MMRIYLCSVSVLLTVKPDFLCGPEQRPFGVNNNPLLGKVDVIWWVYVDPVTLK